MPKPKLIFYNTPCHHNYTSSYGYSATNKTQIITASRADQLLITVRDYLTQKLPEWLSKKAFANVKNENNLNYKVNSLHDAIELAFYWDETNEDVAFWEAVANSKGNKIEVEMEVELMDGPIQGFHKTQIKEFITIDNYMYQQYYKNGVIKYYFVQLI